METTESLAYQVDELFLCDEIASAFGRVWETLLSLPLEKLAEPESALKLALESQTYTGAVVWIGGSWTGNVRIGMPKAFANKVAGELLQSSSPSEEETQDALRELANMTAGNLKSALPGRCGLATPGNFTIKEDDEMMDEFPQILTTWYRSGYATFFLSLSSLEPVS